jgi:hypothetical protein
LFFFQRFFPLPSASPPGCPLLLPAPPPGIIPSSVIEGGLKVFLPSTKVNVEGVPASFGSEARTTGAAKNVEEVLGAFTETGLKPLGIAVDVTIAEVLVDVEGLETAFGFLEAAGANRRAADHPVLLTVLEEDTGISVPAPAFGRATSPNPALLFVVFPSCTPNKGGRVGRPSRDALAKRCLLDHDRITRGKNQYHGVTDRRIRTYATIRSFRCQLLGPGSFLSVLVS